MGAAGARTKVIGPFPEADDAREWANGLGIAEISWQVVPLQEP